MARRAGNHLRRKTWKWDDKRLKVSNMQDVIALSTKPAPMAFYGFMYRNQIIYTRRGVMSELNFFVLVLAIMHNVKSLKCNIKMGEKLPIKTNWMAGNVQVQTSHVTV